MAVEVIGSVVVVVAVGVHAVAPTFFAQWEKRSEKRIDELRHLPLEGSLRLIGRQLTL